MSGFCEFSSGELQTGSHPWAMQYLLSDLACLRYSASVHVLAREQCGCGWLTGLARVGFRPFFSPGDA